MTLYEQDTKFERGRTIELREGGFPYCAIEACMEHNIMTVMRV